MLSFVNSLASADSDSLHMGCNSLFTSIEYVNGQRLVWLHPNGYLMTQQDNGWHMEQLPSHSQPAKVSHSTMKSATSCA